MIRTYSATIPVAVTVDDDGYVTVRGDLSKLIPSLVSTQYLPREDAGALLRFVNGADLFNDWHTGAGE